MLYFDSDIWPNVPDSDLWIFDKLILSRKLGHVCGPCGVDVPTPGLYVVRPCVNLEGMGRAASLEWIERDTSYLPPGSFWQEVFLGKHLSIDFQDSKQIRCSEGIKYEQDLIRFRRWIITDDMPLIPGVVTDFINHYEQVNVEMIGGNVIEVHLRGNPDFNDGAVEVIPIWNDEQIECPDGFTFVPDTDVNRLGFYKRYVP